MIITRPCPAAAPANDTSPVASLDDARLRKAAGVSLLDPAGPQHPRTRLKPGTHACLPNGIVIRIGWIRWVPSAPGAASAVLHAFYMANGVTHSVPLSDLTPATYHPQKD